MNYEKHYNSLITRAQNRILSKNIYTEKHHIVPVTIGGSNEKSNLVRLLPEEHLLAHLLLTRMFPNSLGLAYAVVKMTSCWKYTTGKSYGIIKRAASKRIGESNSKMLKERYAEMSVDDRKKIHGSPGEQNPMYGKTHTEEVKAAMSKAKKLLIGEKHPHFGKPSKLKGLSYEELYGLEKAEKLKNARSEIAKQSPKCKGDKHHTKTLESRQKISLRQQKQTTVNGITYESVEKACEALGISYYKLKKLLKSDG